MNLKLELLEKAAREDRLTHLLLFHGENAPEQQAAALRLAQLLNCTRPAAERPCQACQTCHKIESENHPDVLRLKPLKTSIGIEQVLDWQQKIYLRHYEGSYKISILEQAESMTMPAANALLKVIEEPPERNLIILCVQNAEGILPTIRSRAQAVYFPGLTAEVWLEGLADADRQEARRAFQLGGGNQNLAAAILKAGTESLTSWLEAFWRVVEQKKFHDLYGLLSADKIDKNQATLYLQVMAAQIRRGLQKGTHGPAEFLAVGKALDELRLQVNPRLVLEGLALVLFEQKQGIRGINENGGQICE